MKHFTFTVKLLTTVILIAVGLVPNLLAQSNTVRGKVTSSLDGGGLPGANVLLKGTSTGTISDVEGNFSLNVPSENDTLIFSSIGFITREIALNGSTFIDVALEEDVQSLDEVVVIGYGAQKKVNVIGAVEAVSNKEIVAAPVSNISNTLAGRLPGAIVQQRSGEPGRDEASILIRGSSTLGDNSPLIVVDGIPGRDLNSVNPHDVESISVLKDASAAIYGARAANGVVLVTTKHGSEGAPTFDYSFYQGFLTPERLPEMADAGTYAQMIRELQSYQGVDESNMMFSPEDVEKYRSGSSPWTHPNTNWYDVMLRDFSSTRNHDFSVRGGSKSINYFGSFGSQFADGLYKNSATSFNRYNLRANVDIKVNDYLNVGLNISGAQEKRLGSSADAITIYNVTNQGKPTSVAYYPNGFVGTGSFGAGYNPVLISTNKAGFDDDTRYRSNNIINASLKIPGVEGLTLTSYYAYDLLFKQEKYFNKPLTAYFFDEAAYLAAGNTGSEDGSAFLNETVNPNQPDLRDSYGDSTLHTFNFKVNYDKTFNEVHNISAFVAYENSDSRGQGINATRRYFISDQLPYLFAGGDADKDNSGYVSIDARVNYFGRVSYNYKDTYLFQFAFRRDGSLRFSEENGRWGNFPSILAGWRISNENFWKDNIQFIDFFKLKASWGKLGNDLVPPFQYLASYGFGDGGVYGANKQYTRSLYQTITPNPNITWEVANMYNVGFESIFLEDAFLNTNFFYERRNNILVTRNASVPNFTGLSLPDENFGIVENRGVELELGFNKQKNNVSYGFSGNFAFVRNKVVEMDEPERSVDWQTRTGHPQGSTLLYKSIGIFRDEEQINATPHVTGAIPGDVIIDDYNGDGQITNDDRILFDKTTTPEITYGLAFNFRYKNWELNGLVNGAARAMVRMLGRQQGLPGNYFQYSADGRWTPDNINASKPRAYTAFNPYWRNSHLTDLEFQDMDYARLKNLQISYTLPSQFQNAIGIKNAQLYVSGQNLFIIYASKGIWGPEFSGNRDNYPIMKVFAFGARVSF